MVTALVPTPPYITKSKRGFVYENVGLFTFPSWEQRPVIDRKKYIKFWKKRGCTVDDELNVFQHFGPFRITIKK